MEGFEEGGKILVRDPTASQTHRFGDPGKIEGGSPLVGLLLDADEMVVGVAVGSRMVVVFNPHPHVLGRHIQNRNDPTEDGDENQDR